ALSYAKEAHRLRVKLLQQRFMYSTEQHNDIFGDNGELIQKRGYVLKSFHMHPSVATSAWSSHLQVTVEKQLGDLSRSLFNNTTGNKLYEELSKAETLYRSAVDKLKLTEWKNCVSHPKKTTASNKIFCDSLMIGGIDVCWIVNLI
ncbi:hypothetical protein Tco_0137609, partial [Tanacetum coccineum]